MKQVRLFVAVRVPFLKTAIQAPMFLKPDWLAKDFCFNTNLPNEYN